MPELGEIKKGREIGKSGPYQAYIWHSCVDCGEERWVQYKKGKPVSERCFTCAMNNMKYGLDGMFKGKEQYIKDLVRQMGIPSVMKIYGLKHRPSFTKWLKDNDGDIRLSEPLENMSGGEKDKWVRDNREYILWCVEQFGKDWVKGNFHFKNDTLERLINFGEQSKPSSNEQIDQLLKDLERLKIRCEIEHQDYLDVVEGQKHLEELVVNFTYEITQRLAQIIAKPILEHIVGPIAELEVSPGDNPKKQEQGEKLVKQGKRSMPPRPSYLAKC